MFVGKAGAYTSQALYGKLLALPTNIRLSCKGLSGTNTLGYYEYYEFVNVGYKKLNNTWPRAQYYIVLRP